MQVKTLSELWEETWYRNIFKAYTFLNEQDDYCRAAALAQAMFVMARALKI